MRNARSKILGSVLAVLAFGLLTNQANAMEANQFRFSALVGQVGLFGDPGSGGANAVGFGGSLAYQLDPTTALEIQYLGSSQSAVDHSDLSVGGEYYFAEDTNAFPHASAGMTFLHNSYKNVSLSGDAVGVYLGGGAAFELAKGILLGPEVRYQKAFAAKGYANGREYVTVGDSYTILLRLSFTPEGE